jgi:hypothetical protein
MTQQRERATNRRINIGLALSAVCFLVTVQVSSIYGQGNNGGNNGQSEVQRGFDIAPVELDLAGKNRSLVGLGSYYVNGVSDASDVIPRTWVSIWAVETSLGRSSAAI